MVIGDRLGQIGLFEGLPAEDRQRLSEKLAERRLAPGDVVFHMGDAGASMYLVVSGAVQIFLPGHGDSRVRLKDVQAGGYFGDLALFDDKPRSASAVAVVDTVVLELTRTDFIEHLVHSPTATIAILSELADRLRKTNALLSERAAVDVVKEFEANLPWDQRLADKVAELNGSWAFIAVLILFTAGWAILNALMVHPFDEYPFQFYNLALAILVALQGPLIVMSQNREAQKDRIQARADFRVNLKNEVSLENIQTELGALRKDVLGRLEQLERGGRPPTPKRGAVSGAPTEGDAL